MNENQYNVFLFMGMIPSQANSIPKPFKPTIPNLPTRILRARLLMEETLETIKGLGFSIVSSNTDIEIDNIRFISVREPNLTDIADGLADMEVVLLGTAVACGIDHQPIMREVLRNNELKLRYGTIDEYGKLIKPPNHPAPNIAKEIKLQSESTWCPICEMLRDMCAHSEDESK